MSMIETLTEGIRQRSLANEGEALLSKWEKTGLLEGLSENGRTAMSRLLENQAAQLLKETSTMQSGDVQGFASVAFPIVRRVFGGLLAQDLVSVQPMSLPSGLIFFLDFVYSGDGISPSPGGRLGNMTDSSLYGGGVVGQQISQTGVNLANNSGSKGFYDLNNGFSSPTGSFVASGVTTLGSGTYGDDNSLPGGQFHTVLRSDPTLVSGTSRYWIGGFGVEVPRSRGFSVPTGSRNADLTALAISGANGAGSLIYGQEAFYARRLTQFSASSTTQLLMVALDPDGALGFGLQTVAETANSASISFPLADSFVAAGNPFGAIAGSTTKGGWGLENNTSIPEIDIKVDSLAVTAVTKKLKAKWTPELAQDLNAYHNLDAEVELTSILSEQIALEIDQEILSDLVNGASAGTLWWSRLPGKFVNRDNGAVNGNSLYPDFTGTVSEWYETLLETINDLSARIHRKTLRGGANFVVCSPEVASILEFTSGFKANVEVDGDKGSWGAVNIGSLSRKMDIHVDPYFIRNLCLVGRRGSSFLESGYVYAPYVPLQVTPTIFGTEDFVPRKGVMTRYAKQMVRPDMYGLVVVVDLVG